MYTLVFKIFIAFILYYVIKFSLVLSILLCIHLVKILKMAAQPSPKRDKGGLAVPAAQSESFFDKLGGTLARKKKTKEGWIL